MRFAKKFGQFWQVLRDGVGALPGRISLTSKTPKPTASDDAADAPLFQSFDPTKALFPSDESAEDERGRGLPLSTLLEDSARAMVHRADQLRAQSDGLAMRIGERRDAEITLAAQAIRVLIGLVWLGVAGWLFYSVMNARADGLSVIGANMPVDDARVLIRTFFFVAAAGLGVAFAVATLAKLFGNADNKRVTAEAERLGAAIAEASTEFDHTLTNLRSAMDKRKPAADGVYDLSRAHLTALEAHAFYREVEFLTNAEGLHAQRLFKGFLARPSGGAAPAFPLFLAGALLGAGVTFLAVAPRPEPVEPATALAIMQYPWAAQLLFFGGVLYAAACMFASLFGGALTEGVAAKARAEALTALRSGFTAREAPRPSDVIRRIEDAIDVFRARVGGAGSAGRNQLAGSEAAKWSGVSNQANADFSEGDDIPQWRRRDSSVKFVKTDFAGAPEQWRTDAYAKKFEAETGRDTAAKRDTPTLKNPRRD